MSAIVGHFRGVRRSKSASNSRSLFGEERMGGVSARAAAFLTAVGEAIGQRAEQRLVSGVTAAKGIKFDRAAGEADLGADEPARPVRVDEHFVAEDMSLPERVGAAQVDDPVLRDVE